MNFAKKLYSTLLCISLILTLAVLELLYCAHGTLLSSSHFAGILDKDKELSKFTAMLHNSLAKPLPDEKQSTVSRFTLDMLSQMDESWVQGQVYIAATGLHKYMTDKAVSLPTFDFSPLKLIVQEVLVEEVMRQPIAADKVKKVQTVLAVLSNKYFSSIISFGLNNQVTTMLLELAPVRSTGFDRSTLQEIINIYLSLSSKNMTLEEASNKIVAQMAMDALELSGFKDYFDSNIFLDSAFGQDNPVAGFKTALRGTDKAVSRTSAFLFWSLLLLLLLHYQFGLIKLARIALLSTAAGAAANLILSLILLNQPLCTKLLYPNGKIAGAFGELLHQLLFFLLKDFALYLLLQSVLLAAAGGILFWLSYLLFKAPNKKSKRSIKLPLWRIAVILLAAVVFFSWWNAAAAKKDIHAFQQTLYRLQSSDINESVLKGLSEAGGMEFIKYLQKD